MECLKEEKWKQFTWVRKHKLTHYQVNSNAVLFTNPYARMLVAVDQDEVIFIHYTEVNAKVLQKKKIKCYEHINSSKFIDYRLSNWKWC